MTEFRSPQYLNPEKDDPVQRIRCPIHGFIHYSANEQKIIDHPYFRRLRHIRQLALTEYVYPGATHSRFEHSLGVMEVATRAFDSLASRHGATMEDKFKELPDFKDDTMAKARQVVRLAALMHDIGHAPFSHVAEGYLKKLLGMEHEDIAVEILNKDHLQAADLIQDEIKGMRDIVDGLFWAGCSDVVGKIIQKKAPPQIKILTNLISGEMDADRTDYLLRDSLHCGVDYGRFDSRRMIECLEIWDDGEGGLEIALHRDGIHTFEALILARYQMNTQVYFHRIRRIYDIYLNKYIQAIPPDLLNTIPKLMAENDIKMMHRIFEDAVGGEPDRKKWAERIVGRKHHRLVHETGAAARGVDKANSIRLYQALKQKFDPIEFVHDNDMKAWIHKILKPDEDAEVASWVDLKIIDRDGSVHQVGNESQVLRSIPREFMCPRIFVDCIDGPKRKEITNWARNHWKEMRAR